MAKRKRQAARARALKSPRATPTAEPASKVLAISSRASISLQMMCEEFKPIAGTAPVAFAAGLARPRRVRAPLEEASASVLIETSKCERIGNQLTDAGVRAEAVAEDFLSAKVPLRLVNRLIANPEVRRISSVKRKVLMMDHALIDGRVVSRTRRLVSETGQGVYVAIVDSGFDLSHPMFRAANGDLRVDALLDQNSGRTFTRSQLQTGWAGTQKPGRDEDGHGTHVASIAAGSTHRGFTGVAPDARFLLVKSDMIDLAGAASWAFRRAGTTPCVVNMSLGHHFGAHDGTDAEERVFERLAGPGRIIVVAAGNERTDGIHIGARFAAGQTETAVFDILTEEDPPNAPVTLWYDQSDKFDVTLISPTGQRAQVPNRGSGRIGDVDGARVDLARQAYDHNRLTQVQLAVSFKKMPVKRRILSGWKIEIVCRKAVIGRLDGWFGNSGYAEFRDGPLLETARTIGLPATSQAVIAVASHVSKNDWQSGSGLHHDRAAVVGRSSSFSSRGPTRDGRNKPEVSAAGEYITAALADDSESEADRARAFPTRRLLTIEGTSMATPFVVGTVALALQRAPRLSTSQLRELLRRSATRDRHTGPLDWTPEYGHGKLSVQAMIGALP